MKVKKLDKHLKIIDVLKNDAPEEFSGASFLSICFYLK